MEQKRVCATPRCEMKSPRALRRRGLASGGYL